MSDVAVDKPGLQLFLSEHAGVWARFKWLLPILITVVVTIGASGRSPAKNLSMFKRQARARGRRLSWQRLWCGSGGRSVLGCVGHGLGREVERPQGGV